MSADEEIYTITPLGLVTSVVGIEWAKIVIQDMEKYCKLHQLGMVMIEGRLRFANIVQSDEKEANNER